MHLVYKIIFEERLKLGLKPYYYIGSKANCVIKEGVMYQQGRTKEYWGSSNDPLMNSLIGKTPAVVEELSWFEDYEQCIRCERYYHILYDVVANPEYFNRGIAMENNFSDPNFATYKNVESGKIARIPKEHPDVISKLWVGVTAGSTMSEERRSKIGMPGELNPFYGKTHSEENRQKIKDGQQKWKDENPEEYAKTKMEASERAVRTFKGVPKSEEHKQKIGRKGMVSYKNLNTGITIRMYKDSKEHEELDKTIWVPLVTYSKLTNTLKKICCDHCGVEGIPANIKRWHNDNCKHKKEN
jgi:hypothetical protein